MLNRRELSHKNEMINRERGLTVLFRKHIFLDSLNIRS